MKKKMLLLAVIGAFISIHVMAGPGGGHGKSGFGTPAGSMPPGLQDKGRPPGLEQQDKTPLGWSKGKKTGWKKHHHRKKHSRMTLSKHLQSIEVI